MIPRGASRAGDAARQATRWRSATRRRAGRGPGTTGRVWAFVVPGAGVVASALGRWCALVDAQAPSIRAHSCPMSCPSCRRLLPVFPATLARAPWALARRGGSPCTPVTTVQSGLRGRLGSQMRARARVTSERARVSGPGRRPWARHRARAAEQRASTCCRARAPRRRPPVRTTESPRTASAGPFAELLGRLASFLVWSPPLTRAQRPTAARASFISSSRCSGSVGDGSKSK